nr:major antigen-like [Leptinotarsa decemlineata]
MGPSLFTILIICWAPSIYAQHCSNPNVSRQRLLIYRIIEEVEVQIVRCKYFDRSHPALTYFDITNNCLKTPITSIFVDKWEEANYVNSPNSLVNMEQYKAKADLIRNEIKLRSGTICRYDRGFCYDTKEGNNYAVVWELNKEPHRSIHSCPTSLEQVLYGSVDIWDFPVKQLKYLFYTDYRTGEAFYLRLIKKIDCHKGETWVTEGNEFLVSRLKLTPRIADTKVLNQYYLPVQTSKKVSEAIMKNCEVHDYPLDFSHRSSNEYFENPAMIRLIFQKLKEKFELEINKMSAKPTKGGSLDSNVFLKEINKLKYYNSEKNTQLLDIMERIRSTESNLELTRNDLMNIKKLIGSFNEKYEKDVSSFKVNLSEMSERYLSESRRFSTIISEKERDLLKNFQDLTLFVKSQSNSLVARSEFERKLSDLRDKLNTEINDLKSKLLQSLNENEQLKISLETIHNDSKEWLDDFKFIKNDYDSKLNSISQRMNDSLSNFRNDFDLVLEKITENERASANDQKIEELKKEIEDFKISSKSFVEMKSNNILSTIQTLLTKSVSKEEFAHVIDRIDIINRNIANVQWNFLNNLEDDPISANHLNNKLSELSGKVDEKIDRLRTDFTTHSIQHKQHCNCKNELCKIIKKYENQFEDAKRQILNEAKMYVETRETLTETELNEELVKFTEKMETNREQIIKTLLDKLNEKDDKIEDLKNTLTKEISKLRTKITEFDQENTCNPVPN